MNRRTILDKLFTLIFLTVAVIVTIATSKEKSNYVSPGYTNYHVTSNCPNSINEAAIQVENDYVTSAAGRLDSGEFSNLSLSFVNLGFSNSQIKIGSDESANSFSQCKVNEQTTVENDSTENFPTYRLENPGFLTTTDYQCSTGGETTCNVQFIELKYANFNEAIDSL